MPDLPIPCRPYCNLHPRSQLRNIAAWFGVAGCTRRNRYAPADFSFLRSLTRNTTPTIAAMANSAITAISV